MLLVIDVGNTNIVYGLFEGATLLHQFRVESGRGRTADEYAVTLRQLLAMHDVAPRDARRPPRRGERGDPRERRPLAHRADDRPRPARLRARAARRRARDPDR